MREQYWALVEEGPVPFSRNQRILFWWIVLFLPRLKDHGVLAAPDPTPLTVEEIVEVFERILPAPGESSQSACGQTWSYVNQRLVFESETGTFVQLREGEIEIQSGP